MKHKWYQIFLLFLVCIGLVSTASSFSMDGGETEYNNGELQNKETGEESYVTLDYNDQETLDYKYYINSGDTLSNISALEPNTSGTSHTFIGWSYTKSGFYEDGTSALVNPAVTMFSGGETLYAKYYASGDYTFYSTQEVALSIAPSSSAQEKVYISPSSSTLTSEAMTLTTTINAYYDSSKTAYSTSTYGSDYSVKRPGEAGSLLVLDTDLIIDGGTLKLNSISCYASSGSFTNLDNQISGAFTALDLNGYNIYIRNGGELLGYGIIYNSKDTGGIIVEDGELRTILTPIDYKGGGEAAVRYVNSTLVFAGIILPYLCCETVFSSSSVLSADCSLYANSAKQNTTVAYILGKDTTLTDYDEGIFEITKGYIVRRSTSYLDLIKTANYKSESNFVALLDSNYREEYLFVDDPDGYLESIERTSFYGYNRADIDLGNLTMTLTVSGATGTVSFSYNEFPISSHMSLYMYNCDFFLDMPLIFMPGSYCYVDPDSKIEFSYQYGYNNGYYVFARIAILDSYPGVNADDSDVRFDNSGTAVIIPTAIDSHTLSSFSNARMDMEGTFVFNELPDGVLSTSSSYQFYTLGGNINCSDQALQSIKNNYQYIKLNTYFEFTAYYYTTNSRYDVNAIYCYNQPLISGTKAYFQTSTCGEILEGEVIDGVDDVYYYNGNYYFYKYDVEDCFQFTYYSLNNMATTKTPNSTRTSNHYLNFSGNFVQATSLTYLSDGMGNTTYYTTYSSGYYLPLAGCMMPVDSQPSVSSYSFNTNTVSEYNKFTLPHTHESGYTLGTTIEYNYGTGRWRFA